MQHLFWRVESAFVPPIRRACPRCGHGAFASSGLFRLNANGGRVDVWLIYKCEKCDYTYNLTVYERVPPNQLTRRGVYEKLLANDEALANETARDTALLKKNGAAPIWEGAVYTVTGELPVGTGEAFTLTVELPPNLRLRTDAVLSRKLGASRAAIQRAIKQGGITLAGGGPCPKYLHGVTRLFFHGGLL